MKKFLLFTVASFLFCATAFAQNPYTLSPEAEQRCTELTREMVRELRLNEIGYIKLKALNRELMSRTDEVKQAYSHDAALVEQKIQQITQEYEQNLVAFLKPDQLQAYANYKEAPAKALFVAAGVE